MTDNFLGSFSEHPELKKKENQLDRVTLIIWPPSYQVNSTVQKSNYPFDVSFGHAALKTYRGSDKDKGIYASFWPANSGCKRYGNEHSNSHLHSLKDDNNIYGNSVGVKFVHLEGLDVEKINQAYEKYKNDPPEWTLQKNCSYLVLKLLECGGFLKEFNYTFDASYLFNLLGVLSGIASPLILQAFSMLFSKRNILDSCYMCLYLSEKYSIHFYPAFVDIARSYSIKSPLQLGASFILGCLVGGIFSVATHNRSYHSRTQLILYQALKTGAIALLVHSTLGGIIMVLSQHYPIPSSEIIRSIFKKPGPISDAESEWMKNIPYVNLASQVIYFHKQKKLMRHLHREPRHAQAVEYYQEKVNFYENKRRFVPKKLTEYLSLAKNKYNKTQKKIGEYQRGLYSQNKQWELVVLLTGSAVSTAVTYSISYGYLQNPKPQNLLMLANQYNEILRFEQLTWKERFTEQLQSIARTCTQYARSSATYASRLYFFNRPRQTQANPIDNGCKDAYIDPSDTELEDYSLSID